LSKPSVYSDNHTISILLKLTEQSAIF